MKDLVESKRQRYVVIGLVALVLLNVVDWIHTANIITTPIAVEGNPIMLYFLERWGIQSILWVKLTVLFSFLFGIRAIAGNQFIFRFFFASVAFYTGITCWHVLLYLETNGIPAATNVIWLWNKVATHLLWG